MIDLRSKFILLRNPNNESVWIRLRRVIAELIYPPLRAKRWEWIGEYFKHEYMLSVHKHYERESRKLNLALSRKEKELKELRNKLRASNPTDRSS